MDNYERLHRAVMQLLKDQAGRPLPETYTLPYGQCFIRLRGSPGPSARRDFIKSLSIFVNSDDAGISDTKSIVDTTRDASDTVLIFFTVVAGVASLLCFFMLWESFLDNVRENSWEFGIVRSLGLSSSMLIRAYIYEGLVMILAATIIGMLIGVGVAITLTLQFNLFVELSFVFDFPLTLFLFITGTSLFLAIVGSYLPARLLKQREIAQVLRGI